MRSSLTIAAMNLNLAEGKSRGDIRCIYTDKLFNSNLCTGWGMTSFH